MDDNTIFWEDPLFDTVNIAEAFNADDISFLEWENMLATGWRHNAMMFFRVSSQLDENDNKLDILPLRYQLNQFEMSKSQRKVWRKNQDLTFKLVPLSIRDDMHFMFDQHIQRFKYNVPHSIFDFVSYVPNKPFPTYQFEVYKLDKLIGCTFVDITPHTLSSTYAMFDLEESKRSLGIFTMLLEMVYALTYKKTFHYPGYAYLQPSYMDYKKQFSGAEYYDWLTGNWFKL